MIFFVDDIFVLDLIKDVKKVDNFKIKLFKLYEIRYLRPLECFLSIFVVRDRFSLYLWLY